MFLQTLNVIAFLACAVALSPADWRKQSIYQVVTDRFALSSGGDSPSCTGQTELSLFCNGSFAGIIKQLDYIHDMGFTALWISPVVENLQGGAPDGYTPDGSAYHGYWAQDIYAVNQHFGGASGLSALSSALHKRGMEYLMVDIVVNHMGYYCGEAKDGSCGQPGTIDYSVFNPFNEESYYHPFCEIDYSNATSILDCWEGDEIVPLVDLRTENATVQQMWDTWVKGFVANYSIDGLRVDSLQQSGSFFFPSFWQSAGQLYMVGEVFQEYPSQVCPYQQNGMPGVLNYPMFYYITDAFQTSSGSMTGLANGIEYMQNNCSDVTLLGSFLENQDNPRFPSGTADMSRAMNAIAFTLLQDGIPITYYGQEQHLNGAGVPQNREALWSSGGYNVKSSLYTMISSVNGLRNLAIKQNSGFVTYKIQTPYFDDHTIVTRKGATGAQIVGVYTNLGENGNSYDLTLSSAVTGFTASAGIVDVLTCTLLTTDSQGSLVVPMASGQPRILYSQSGLKGSGICNSTQSAGTSTTQNCTDAAVTFQILVNTSYGESVVIAGDIPSLGNWEVTSALKLSASNYTAKNPLWYGTATGVDPGAVFQWKPVVIEKNGTYEYSSGDNLQDTAPTGCNPASTLKYTFNR